MYRVTQSMLSNSTLNHISDSYKRLAKFENQLSTGKKINRPSDDPVSAMQGIRYRTEVIETNQFLERNITQTKNWMDNSDSSLDKVTQAMHRIRELTTQAANDTYEHSQRESIQAEINQIMEHIESLANTKANNKYIFNGTSTDDLPVDLSKFDIDISDTTFQGNPGNYYIMFDHQTNVGGEIQANTGKYTFTSSTAGVLEFTGPDNKKITIDTANNNTVSFNDGLITTGISSNNIVIADRTALPSNNSDVKIEVMKGIQLGVNVKPNRVFSSEFFGDIALLSKALTNATTGDQLSPYIDKFENHVQNILSERAELGARMNRIDMIENRVAEQVVIAQKIMSENEDIDAEKVIIDLKSQETLHRAAMAAGARIMQPTLMDFLR